MLVPWGLIKMPYSDWLDRACDLQGLRRLMVLKEQSCAYFKREQIAP